MIMEQAVLEVLLCLSVTVIPKPPRVHSLTQHRSCVI